MGSISEKFNNVCIDSQIVLNVFQLGSGCFHYMFALSPLRGYVILSQEDNKHFFLLAGILLDIS